MAPPSILDPTENAAQSTPTRRMSEDEFVDWALAHEARAEWVDGEVVQMSPVALKHIRITGWLFHVLGLYIQINKLGELLGSDFTVRLQQPTVSRRLPDLFYISQARSSQLAATYLDGPPDLAIEVVSPDSVDRDWQDKRLEYEAAGVSEYWIIDPLTETFQGMLRNSNGRFDKLEIDASGVFRSPTVPGFWLKPDWLWQPELPDPVEFLRELGVL